MGDNSLWLIWSVEHGAWWRANRSGYTCLRSEAGRYKLDEAVDICNGANEHVSDKDAPYETMVACV